MIKSRLLILLMLFSSFRVYSQIAVIKFIVEDKRTGNPVSNAKIKENPGTVGITNSSGATYIMGKTIGKSYDFSIERDDYEPAERSVFVSKDTTIISPVVKLHSLNDLRNQLINIIKTGNKSEALELKIRIESAYDKNNQFAEKKEFLKELQKYKIEYR
jgi:hypothetical protein